ncbi:MAG: hypothetical protein JJ850_00800 [Kordiimonadaceae bacterium]|nr:hypothetical protein [Kordiimonadaceae bacterium]MBO6567662.1 hypothetical protein [Kordiimonadaceae bacterium]MBO6963124.1 hypothetical protein [Kordiimonadaceae bacterium]
MKKILITSVGSNVGGNFQLCLAHRRDEFYFIGTNLLAETAFNFMCDEAHLVPPVADEGAFVDAHARLVDECKPALVVAGRDQDVSILSKMRASGSFPDTEFLVPSIESAGISNDKYLSYKFAEANGLPFARSAKTFVQAQAIVAETGYPLIAKPRMNGHASKDVFIVRSEEELRAAVEAGGFVIQEMVGHKNEPEDYNPVSECGVPLFYSYAISDQISGQALIGYDSKVLYQIASMNYYSFGRSQKYVPIGDTKVLDIIRGYAEALAKLGHFGPLNLQGKLDKNGDLVIYEINMRFTGATQGRTVLGWTEVEYAVDYIFDGISPNVSFDPVDTTFAVREPFAYALDTQTVGAMRERGYWKR